MHMTNKNIKRVYKAVKLKDIEIVDVVINTNIRKVLVKAEKLSYHTVNFTYKEELFTAVVQVEWMEEKNSFVYYNADWGVHSKSLKKCIRKSHAWDLDYMKTLMREDNDH